MATVCGCRRLIVQEEGAAITLWRRLADRAFGIPRGILGRLGSLFMSTPQKRKMAAAVIDELGVEPGDRVLEVGFGTGLGLEQAAGAVGSAGRVVGVDPSELMYEKAALRNAQAVTDGRMRLKRGTAEDLPFADAAFTHAFSMNSYQLWSDRDLGLREIHRVLKPGGTLALSFDGFAGLDDPDRLPPRFTAAGFKAPVQDHLVGLTCFLGHKPGD